jgi:hypothetical protein
MRETDGVEVSFQLEGIQSDPVELTNGLLQGDPPSPAYFTATTDRVLKPVVAKWEKNKIGLHLDGSHMPLVGWMDDLYVLASSPEDLQTMVRQICNACSPTGLELQPPKCQWGTSAPDAEEFSITVRGRALSRVPKAEGFQVLGSQLAFNASPNQEYAIRLSKSWKAFWANSALLLNPRVSYFTRVKLFHSVVSPVALYAAPAMYHTCKHLHNLDITQREMVAKIVRRKRRPGEQWLPWFRRTRRESTDILKCLNILPWSVLVQKRKLSWAGHIARLDPARICAKVCSWRDLEWWRKQQAWIALGASEFRHPARFGCPQRWESFIERFQIWWAESDRCERPWRLLARNRDSWYYKSLEFLGLDEYDH